MAEPEIRIGTYCGTLVARGGFASVYRTAAARGRPLALKIADADADELTRASILHEFRVQSELVYHRIPRAHAYGIHERRPYVLLDWIDGPPLWEFTPPASGDAAFEAVLRAIADVLTFVHHRGWVHGDLKPENFRWKLPSGDGLSTPTLCLLDFGLARPVGDVDRPRGAGTIGYCAPEFLNKLPADGRADWYSVGAILYEHIFGQRPYAADDPAEEVAGHLEGTPDFNRPRINPCSDEHIELIRRLLSKSADERGADLPALLNSLGLNEGLYQQMTLAQLPDYHACEDQRLGPGEADLAAAIVAHPGDWNVFSYGRDLSALQRTISSELLEQGLSVIGENDDRSGAAKVMTDPASTVGERFTIRLNSRLRPIAVHSVAGNRTETHVCLLPWGIREIGDYVAGIVAEEDVAAQCAPTILSATGGLPVAVSELLGHLIKCGGLTLGEEGWEFDREAVFTWRAASLAACVEDQFGALESTEREICEWLALGEGLGSIAALRAVCGLAGDALAPFCRQLVDRGFVVWNDRESEDRIALRLRIPGHDVVLRNSLPAQALADRSATLAETLDAQSPEPRPVRRLILAHAYERAGQFDQAADFALRTAEVAISADDRDKAFAYIAHAQSCAERISDPAVRSHWQGQAYMVEGDLQKALGQLDVARKIYRELLAICRVNGDQRLLAETLYDLGELYRIMRRYDKGIRVEQRARRLWETLGDRKELSRTLNGLGNLYWVAADLNTAREYYLQALAIQKELKLDRLVATNLNNLGAIHIARFEYEQAESYLSEALTIQDRIGAPVERARNLNNLGSVKFLRGQLDEATDFFTRAASLNGEAGAQAEELFNRRNLVEVALEQGNLRTAATLGRQVHSECRELGDVSTGAEVSALLADAYQRAGDFHLAARFHDETCQAAAELKNDELQTYLSIQEAFRAFRLGDNTKALQLLDGFAPVDRRLANRYQYLDTLILRVQIASTANREDQAAQLWEAGLAEAKAIAAPHKAAQLDWARLSGQIHGSDGAEVEQRVETFLQSVPRWHWVSAFRVWQATSAFVAKSYDDALAQITAAGTQLRRDGNGETLWRALVIQGQICHAQADYEPAMRALDEAQAVLTAIAGTIDDENGRTAYLGQPLAKTLTRIRSRIEELVA